MVNADNEGTKKIDVINGLRGIAIIAVIYQHTIASHLGRLIEHPLIVCNGWVGVSLFFILSGFVLYKPYLLKQRDFTTKEHILEFLSHRFFRLYPLFFFVCIISLVFVSGISSGSIKNLFETVSTLSMFDSEQYFPSLNAVFWSLILEIWFSILFPFLIYFFSKFGFRRVIYIIFIFAFLVRFAGSYYKWTNVNVNPIKDCVIARIDDFILGMIICKIYFEKHKIFNLNNTVLFTLSLVFILTGCLAWDYITLYNGPRELMAITNNFFQAGFLFLIVLALKEDNLVHRLFRIKILQLAGLMCFSLYAWHALVISVFNISLSFSIIKLICYYFFTFIISALTYRYIEFGSEKNWKKLFLFE
jgi:peptidoglycan/LPS O-acetylase OafA/YrhL